MLLAILLLLAPLGLRELVHWRCVPRSSTSGSGKTVGGHLTAGTWNALYVVLLSLALYGAIERALWEGWIIGLPLLWSGALLRAWAYRALGRHYTVTIFVREDHTLVTSGPYRWLRHPLHLGLNLEMLGLALVGLSTLSLGLAGLGILVLFLRNRIEERALVEGLGESYRGYREHAWDVIDLLPARLRGS
ncbi:MAG TPA: isoprenylcysteine carboxylmethyltransferase family protein [Candidatus Eisenbacteria bacterium]|nr:isoprenylcysteine carboxylmethyltransferase family protein [Candidatus Eisenbacteria bacterium]